MAYTPPAPAAINFNLHATGYDPPARDAIALEMSLSGAPAVGFAVQSYALSADVSALLAQPYHLIYGTARGFVEQVYTLIAETPRGFCTQAYGFQAMATCRHMYGDAAVALGACHQYYAAAGTPRRALSQPYGTALACRRACIQPYAVPAGVVAVLDQPWALGVSQVRASCVAVYDLRENTPCRAALVQPYSFAGDAGEVLTHSLTVICGGVAVDAVSVRIEASRDQYCLSATVTVASQADYLAMTPGADLVVTIDATEFRFVVESRSRRREHGAWEYSASALSRASLLDEPHALPLSDDTELSGMASAIAATLAGDIPVSWETVDWYLPPLTLIPGEETPLALLRRLAAAAGAVVQSSPDGSIVVRPAWPVTLPDWVVATPDHLTGDDDHFAASESYEHQTGYNRFLISDQLDSQETLRLEEETISGAVKEIRGYRTPWAEFGLRTTGGGWVAIESMGTEEREVTETVEIIAGAGQTAYPIYGITALDWLHTSLGSVTHAEDGRLETSTEGESLLSITYTTRCMRWRATDLTAEQVQFVAEELAA